MALAPVVGVEVDPISELTWGHRRGSRHAAGGGAAARLRAKIFVHAGRFLLFRTITAMPRPSPATAPLSRACPCDLRLLFRARRGGLRCAAAGGAARTMRALKEEEGFSCLYLALKKGRPEKGAPACMARSPRTHQGARTAERTQSTKQESQEGGTFSTHHDTNAQTQDTRRRTQNTRNTHTQPDEATADTSSGARKKTANKNKRPSIDATRSSKTFLELA